MGVKEKALTAASSIASGDFLRMVTSAGAARKIDYSKLAKAIVEEYNGSTIAGSAQTLKAALDSLNSNKLIITDPYSIEAASSGTVTLETAENAVPIAAIDCNRAGWYYNISTRYNGGHIIKFFSGAGAPIDGTVVFKLVMMIR